MELHEELTSKGVLCTAIGGNNPEASSFSVTDPDGNTIEFLESHGEGRLTKP
jgi:hypothetical protein